MTYRITLDLPQPLADRIGQLAHEHLRYPKQEIIWLLQEAVVGLEKNAPAVCGATKIQGQDFELAREMARAT